jgi:tRNA (cytidine/uridine-2'-O-)-methyltransferase
MSVYNAILSFIIPTLSIMTEESGAQNNQPQDERQLSAHLSEAQKAQELEQSRIERAIRRAREKAQQREHVARKHELYARRLEEQKREQEREQQEFQSHHINDDADQPQEMFEYGYRKKNYGPDELITDAHGNPISVAQAMLDSRTAAATPTSTPHLAYYSPRIPGNTGSAIRLCAVTGTILHLIEPLGFNLKDTKLRRAGLDYHDMAHVVIHPNFDEMADSMPNSRIIAFTAHATKLYTDIQYRPTDILLFGPEPGDIPDPLDIMYGPRVAEQVRLPMRPALRSLNLTNTAAIAIYEAWRQLGFKGGK